MICFIKDKKTFTTKAMETAVDYEIKESIYDTVSTVTIPTPKVLPEEGDFLMFDGNPFVGIIKEVEIDGGETELSVEQAVKLFSREMFYTSASYTYLEDYLESLIDTNYTNCTDEVYEVPFLSVTAASHTSGNCKPDLEDNVYDIKSYITLDALNAVYDVSVHVFLYKTVVVVEPQSQFNRITIRALSG